MASGLKRERHSRRGRAWAWSAGFAIAAVVAAVAHGRAQERQTGTTNDPRVGLKAGMDDAGQAARNIELVGHTKKPDGFFDPANLGSLNFANSDIAFQKDLVFQGNFGGFNLFNAEDPRRPALRVSVQCPGGQGDLSVYGKLLFMSVEQTRGRIDCGAQGVTATSSPERFRGVRIFDISNIDRPRQVAAVQTCRGSHTHTLVVDPKDKANIYVYGSGTSGVRPGDELAGCSPGQDPKDDPNTALFSIDVIQVPLAAPDQAKVVNRPRIFADLQTGVLAGIASGGSHPEAGGQPGPSRATNQCHDITTYPAIGLAAGACSGNGILLDISDPVHPVRLDAVSDPNFAYWHSATFNNDGTKVLFSDEWGGGTQPRCRATDPIIWGGDAIFDIVDHKMTFRGYFKMPAVQTDQENCVAHNGSLVPVPGRDIMVQAWYQGGLSVFDFTDSAHPVEIAFFDRGPIDATKLILGGYWSAYWYNGRIYGSEIARGLDIFTLKPSEFLSQNEIDAASLVHFDELNVQHQPKMAWPATWVVARAYLDQLNRSKGIKADRAAAVKAGIDRAEKASGAQRAAALDQLDALTKDLDKDATAASGLDAVRLQTLASTLRVQISSLR
ncbi:MAG: LVIVD repeat-containing protein [Vicinamibacterales bacterium]